MREIINLLEKLDANFWSIEYYTDGNVVKNALASKIMKSAQKEALRPKKDKKPFLVKIVNIKTNEERKIYPLDPNFEKHTRAWWEGFATQRPKTSGPYKKGTDDYLEWVDGWETRFYGETL